VDPLLKTAYDEGVQRAEEELAKKLKDAVKKREALVGWKEQSKPPAKLSKHLK
jgi:hypothetical protein